MPMGPNGPLGKSSPDYRSEAVRQLGLSVVGYKNLYILERKTPYQGDIQQGATIQIKIHHSINGPH